jgi:hypothetical protein
MSETIAAPKAEPYDEMENRLANVLRRVEPPRKFVQSMRSRINFAPSVTVAKRLHDTRYMFLMVGGVLTASVLVATVVRALFYLVNKSRT